MRSELRASKKMPSTALRECDDDAEPAVEEDPSVEPVLPPVVVVHAPPAARSPPKRPGTNNRWTIEPVIGGFKIDFDSSGSKARIVLQDASKFDLSSMYRKTDRKARREGVALHMGRREDTYEEEVISVLFDIERVAEHEAAAWWADHEHRFSQYIRK